ncbi:hypothetical protein C7974DRAFT_448848 [Boeremia exigua]|uniref:uncharacterized protein n=1 Tax=Boeremia exigua TaxID=749465 RepID=UPI001E8EE626|nr:uncharacterized protein C7974DRAFT_448848 [Boeremia exigua]KAH6639024.1 hypothetical protein C7974DRAFT_448848 [Boeremia exigua]
MKPIHLTLFALLSLLVTCRVLPLPRPDVTSNVTSLALFDGGFRNFQPSPVLVAANDPTPQPDPSEEPVGERPAFWHRYVCRGRKLHNACLYNKDKAVQYATPIDSPFDAAIGVNAEDGIVHFFDVRSAYEGAKRLWAVENAPMDELPALRQISDMAWGAWRRKHLDGQNLGKIRKFMVHTIINDITMDLIDEALKTYVLAPGEIRLGYVPFYPGVTFDMNSEEGAAMLGSPNGIAVGYFLAQHKTQLGGNRYVYKVQIFDQEHTDATYMVFWIADEPLSWEGQAQQENRVEGAGKILKRSLDGRNVLREHIVTTELSLQDIAVQA